MGWTYTHRGNTPIKYFLATQINCENEHGRWQLQDIAIVKLRTAYMAVEIIRRNKETGRLSMEIRKVVAFVFLLDYRPGDAGGYDMGYKDMDESMGPYESECPEKILNLLTPTEHEHALAWRQRCRENIARKNSFRLIKDTIIETQPISFRDGYTRSRFQVVRVKPLQLLCLDTRVLCKVSRTVLQKMLKKATSIREIGIATGDGLSTSRAI